MSEISLEPFGYFCQDPEKIKGLPLTQTAFQLFWKYQLSEIGQWPFTPDELELLSIYAREGVMAKFKEMCLVPWENGFLSKGVHYFKEYPKRYGPKQYFSNLEEWCQLLEKIATVAFEEEDCPLQLKTLLIIADEIINHLCWGIYLAYQAAGIRKTFNAHITPNDIESLQKATFLAAQMYLELLTHTQLEPQNFGQQILHILRHAETFRFIATLAEKGTKGNDGSFYRLRWGAHELENIIQAWKIKDFLVQSGIKLDAVVSHFYASLSAGAFLYTVLLSVYPNVQYLPHVYTLYEDHIRVGEWNNLSQREILARILQAPPLVRPDSNVAEKAVFALFYALDKGDIIKGVHHYYRELGAKAVYLSAVEAEPNQIDMVEGHVSYENLELVVPPTFKFTGVAPWRHQQKYVARSRQ